MRLDWKRCHLFSISFVLWKTCLSIWAGESKKDFSWLTSLIAMTISVIMTWFIWKKDSGVFPLWKAFLLTWTSKFRRSSWMSDWIDKDCKNLHGLSNERVFLRNSEIWKESLWSSISKSHHDFKSSLDSAIIDFEMKFLEENFDRFTSLREFSLNFPNTR